MKWIIYYGDDTTFSSDDGTVWLAPALDVQVIAQEDKDYNIYFQTSADYYVWDTRAEDSDPRWWGVDIFGLWDYLVEPGYKKVIFGRTTTSEKYQEIFFRAKADLKTDKSIFRRGERRP